MVSLSTFTSGATCDLNAKRAGASVVPSRNAFGNQRPRVPVVIPTAVLYLLGFVAGVVHAGQVPIVGGVGSFNVNVASRVEASWQTVIRQQYDYSCGSAALATLLTYHYDTQVSEQDVFRAMYSVGNQEKIQAEGFSMLDLKRYLDRLGLRSDGFRLTVDKLAELGVPAITLVNTQGYKHFVVVRGIREDDVLVADPAAGSIAVPRAHFEKIWNGLALAARGNLKLARARFNYERDWKVWPTAPVGSAVSRGDLGIFSLTLPGLNELGR